MNVVRLDLFRQKTTALGDARRGFHQLILQDYRIYTPLNQIIGYANEDVLAISIAPQNMFREVGDQISILRQNYSVKHITVVMRDDVAPDLATLWLQRSYKAWTGRRKIDPRRDLRLIHFEKHELITVSIQL